MKRVKDHKYLYRRGDALHFRRNIPPYARHAFEGRNEIWISLGTASIAEARHLLTREIAKFERTLAQATNKIAPVDVVLPPMRGPERPEIGEAVRDWFAERADKIHSDLTIAALSDVRWQENELEVFIAAVRAGIAAGGEPPLATQWIADELVTKRGWAITPDTPEYIYLIRLVGRGQIEAAEQNLREIRGLPRRVIDETFSPEQYVTDGERRRQRAAETPVSLHDLFRGYAAERKPSPATVKAWTRQLRAFTDFLGHDDARRVRSEDVVRWKDHLLNRAERPLSAKTVGDTYLSVIKTTFRWGMDNHKVTENPATIRVRKPRREVTRETAGLDDDEALKILRATLLPPPKRLSVERAYARRWVPWICAYTGARVNEITQLRAEDVVQRSTFWTIRITPEAGSVKSGRARTVALHPHLIEQGFPDFVRGKSGHLFFDPVRRRGGSDENPQSKKVGEHLARWVREIGVDDAAVQPNHGWRHRFTTMSRNCRMNEEIRHYILGHIYPTQAQHYGEISPEMTLREIKLLPKYVV